MFRGADVFLKVRLADGVATCEGLLITDVGSLALATLWG